MSFNKKKFESKLPVFFSSVQQVLSEFGLIPTLVGGIVRDFHLFEQMGKDWDIEISHETIPFSKDIWKQFGKSLGALWPVSYLAYEVIRLQIQNYELEFSPPRKEKFETHLSGLGHKNFSVEFDFKMPFSEAVKRRDFTINAMGLRFKGKEIEFLDPLDGLRHLDEKLLHPAGEDFSKDPVRFLRDLRFASKYQMEISPELKVQLQSMDASGFSAAYLWSEMQKSSDPIGFYYLVLKWSVHHPEMKLPLGQDTIPKLMMLKKFLSDPSHHESWMIALEWADIPCEPWQKYFAHSSESARRISRWARQTKSFKLILPETFHGEFEEVIKLAQFEILFDWYFTTKQLLQKSPEIPLLKMIEDFLPDWIHLYRFEVVKDVKHIDPPLRAKYQVWNLCQRL